jgi:hypothetical protein
VTWVLFSLVLLFNYVLIHLFIWQHFFASFLSRDEAFKIINDGWLRQVNDARLIMEQQVF